MTAILQQIVNGLSLGSIYALIALGYTMVYGIIKLINFAHGDIYMVGAYVAFFAVSLYNMNLGVALLLAMLVAAGTGVLIERVAYRPLRNAPRIAALITAIGVSFILENGGILVLKPDPRAFPDPIQWRQIRLLGGGLVLSTQDLFIVGVTVAMMLLLVYFVQRTRTGRAMRAVAYDMQAAALMGIDVDRTIAVTFAVGSALAAVAGLLVGLYYNRIDPLMGLIPGLKAFIAAVLGGIGSIPGAMLGGYLLGVIEALVGGTQFSLFRDAVSFALLILILLVRPAGLLGRNVREKV
ncbi:MAG: branched-chain amino acid ABC transporter permease [Clostridia bacterium]|nr:branched-chain amino acid ABC transporter permease [Clostridia bacterium]MCL6522857.1 branched-chain amino acid ABC transporter permease [Bacillota bacterium]